MTSASLELPVCFAFMTPVANRLLRTAEGVAMDGTFFPSDNFEQLFIISAFTNGDRLPLVWSYMSRRRKEDYIPMLRTVFAGLLPDWIPGFVMTGESNSLYNSTVVSINGVFRYGGRF